MICCRSFYFVSLDIFRKTLENEGIRTKLDAWFTFLCTDEPDYIGKLIEQYPEFGVLYEDVYRICMNMERVIGLFSEELQMLDRNTARYMMDTIAGTACSWKLIAVLWLSK